MNKIYTEEELMEKTVAELRELCKGYNIVGMSKARKDDIIETILAFYDETEEYTEDDGNDDNCSDELNDKVPYITANVHSILKNNTYHSLISVSCGAASSNYPVVGRTVGFVKATYREILNVETDAKGVVNGVIVNDSQVLKSGDILEFVRQAGSKG